MHSGANGSPSRPGIRLVVGVVGIALVVLQLVPVLLGGRLPLPLRHAASELAELRLLADGGDAYRTSLLLLPGWIYLVVGAALAKALPLWLVQRLLLGIAIGGAPLLAERFARALGRPYLGLLGAAAISASSVLYYGLTAHLLSLLPFWWGAWALVKQVDDPRATRRGTLAVALLLCAGLSGPTFVVLAVGVVATVRRDSWLRDLLPVVPAALVLATGYASIGAHPEFIQPGDEWGFSWAGNWPILRELRGQIFEGAAPTSVRWLPLGLLAALLVLVAPSRHPEAAAAPRARVVRVLLAAALFLFFYLPRGASSPIRLEAITLRLVTIWIPLLLLAGRPLAGWRTIAALPLVAVAVLAPLGARTQLAAIARPLGVYQLAEDATPKGRLCVVGAEQVGPQLSPLSIEARTEGAELWGYVVGGGALPDTRRAVGPLAVAPLHPPTGPSPSLLAERGVQSGESCDDYLVYRPPVMLDRDPTLQRRADRVFWVHYRRIHPRQETP